MLAEAYSGRREQAIVLAEMIAREHVEIGTGDADHPRLLAVRGRMDHAGAIGFRLARPEPILAHRLEDSVLLAFRIGAAPFGHFGIFPRIAVNCPCEPWLCGFPVLLPSCTC